MRNPFEQIPLEDDIYSEEKQKEKNREVEEEDDETKNTEKDVPKKEKKQEKEKNIENEQELREFLDKEVFTKLGLTENDEKQELERIRGEIEKNPEKIPPVMEEVTKKSFGNTRKCLETLFRDYSLKGVTDYQKFRKEIYPNIFNEEAKKMGCFKEKSPGDACPELHYWVYLGTKETDILYNKIDKRIKEEPPQEKFNPEKILNFISNEIQEKSKNAMVTINTCPSVVDFWLKHGRAISTSDVAENEELERELNNRIENDSGASLYYPSPSQGHFTNKQYIKTRKKLEEKLKLKFNGRYPIYGALAMNKKELKEGGAPAYGDIIIFLDKDAIKDKVSFTSKDSLDNRGAVPRFTYKHALIIKSMHNFIWKHSNYVDLSKGFDANQPDSCRLFGRGICDYIEAQIIGGLDTKDISKIKIGLPSGLSKEILEEEKKFANRFIKKLKENYPQFKDKIEIDKKLINKK